jgi:hypothetical protein
MPPLVEQACGKQALALLRQPDAARQGAEELAEAVTEHFKQQLDSTRGHELARARGPRRTPRP